MQRKSEMGTPPHPAQAGLHLIVRTTQYMSFPRSHAHSLPQAISEHVNIHLLFIIHHLVAPATVVNLLT